MKKRKLFHFFQVKRNLSFIKKIGYTQHMRNIDSTFMLKNNNTISTINKDSRNPLKADKRNRTSIGLLHFEHF